jgi:hypothetical protein
MLRHLPILLAMAGVASIVITEWVRYRSYLKHRGSGFVPGTQHFALAGTFVAGAFFIGAVVTFAMLRLMRRRERTGS